MTLVFLLVTETKTVERILKRDGTIITRKYIKMIHM